MQRAVSSETLLSGVVSPALTPVALLDRGLDLVGPLHVAGRAEADHAGVLALAA